MRFYMLCPEPTKTGWHAKSEEDPSPYIDSLWKRKPGFLLSVMDRHKGAAIAQLSTTEKNGSLVNGNRRLRTSGDLKMAGRTPIVASKPIIISNMRFILPAGYLTIA
jgi:hypothetical protein